MKMKTPFISIIIPVKNGGSFFAKCMKSISNLNYPKRRYKVIIVDGHSTDNTVKIAKKYGAKVYYEDVGNRSGACNVGLKHAKGEYVAFTDADCIVDKNWLKNSLKYFKDKVVGVGGTNITPKDDSIFAKAVGFIFSTKFLTGGSAHGALLKKPTEITSLPGCNAIYKANVLKKGFDEKLITAEDTEVNYRIKKAGGKLLYAPDVFVYHYRRSTPKSFWKQIYRYGIGRAQAGKKFKDMVNSFHIAAGLFIPILFIVSALSIIFQTVILFIPFIIIPLYYMLKALVETRSIRISLAVILGMIILVFAWSLGFLKEAIHS